MSSNQSILGVDIGEKYLTISCFLDGKEQIHAPYPLEKPRDMDEVMNRIEGFYEEHHLEDRADYVIYTCENYPMSKCKMMEKKLREGRIGEQGIHFISKEKALTYYVMQEQEELHKHTVLMFEFDGKELKEYRLFHPKKKTPKELSIEKKILGSVNLAEGIPNRDKLIDQKFAETAGKILSQEVVSSVYLTGYGFDGGWMQKTLKVICSGRRAFYGQNLFSSGCGRYGIMLAGDKKQDYLIQDPEMVLYESGVIDSGTEDSFVSITKPGKAWYETKDSLDMIIERGNRIDIVFVQAHTGEKQIESVFLELPGNRPRKTGRIEVTVEFSSPTEGVITARDKGFGYFVPATHQVFMKEFTLH